MPLKGFHSETAKTLFIATLQVLGGGKLYAVDFKVHDQNYRTIPGGDDYEHMELSHMT